MSTRTKSAETTGRIQVKNKPELIELLNRQLANLSDLYSQTKHSHWNVKGNNFIALHELFDKLAEEVEDKIDKVAERVGALGGYAKGTVRQVAEGSHLDEFPDGVTDSESILEILADAYATVGNSVRESIDQAEELEDANTADLFTEVSRSLDQSLYFLESHNV
jgi:starvation-inducible DNA-binding protein